MPSSTSSNKKDSMMDAWARQRLAELQAAAPVKHKKDVRFVMLSLPRTAKACAATNCQKAMVWVWLTYRVWQTKSATVAIPNSALARYGIIRKVKYLALKQLEAAGLISVERRHQK